MSVLIAISCRGINLSCKLHKDVNACLLLGYLTDKQLLLGFAPICAGSQHLGAGETQL